MANDCTFYPKTGQVGFELFIETGVDVSGATEELSIRYKKPSGETGSWAATAKVLDGKTGCSYVTATVDDIDEEGKWTFQVYAESPTYALYGNKTRQEFAAPMSGSF